MTAGRIIGERYELLELVGQGSMGAVWRAHEVRSGDTVAVKVLHPHLAADGELSRRFEREGSIDIASPHAVRALASGVDGGTLYLVMEFVDGEPLSAILARGALPARRAREIAREVAHALAAAHAVGTLHRDVKPSNILIDGGGRAHLTDFGIARVAEATRATSTGTFMGSLPYASPEQFLGGVVPESDLYSLGVVLYEMLDGAPPFVADEAAGYMRMHLSETPPGLDALERRHGLPAGVAARLLEKEPARRIASANEVVAILEERAALSPLAPAAAADAATRVLQVRRKRPSPALMAVGALAIASVAASALVAWTAGGSGDGVDAGGKDGVQNGASTPTPDAAAYVRAVATGEAHASATAVANAYLVAVATAQAATPTPGVGMLSVPAALPAPSGTPPQQLIRPATPQPAVSGSGMLPQRTAVTVTGIYSISATPTSLTPTSLITISWTTPTSVGGRIAMVSDAGVFMGWAPTTIQDGETEMWAPCDPAIEDGGRQRQFYGCVAGRYQFLLYDDDAWFRGDKNLYGNALRATSNVVEVYCPIPEPCDIR